MKNLSNTNIRQVNNLIYNLAVHISSHNFNMNRTYGTDLPVLIPSIMCRLYDHPAIKMYLEDNPHPNSQPEKEE